MSESHRDGFVVRLGLYRLAPGETAVIVVHGSPVSGPGSFVDDISAVVTVRVIRALRGKTQQRIVTYRNLSSISSKSSFSRSILFLTTSQIKL